MKKSLYFLLFLLLLAPSVFAIDRNDYYIMDSVTYKGVRLVDFGIKENVQFCHELTSGKVTTFTPNQVKEYSIGGEILYVAMDINLDYSLKRVFFEKRVFGLYSLYHYMDKRHDLFYLQKGNGPLMELPKQNHSASFNREKLAEYTKECSDVVAKSRQVNYSVKDLSFYLQQVKDCRINPFPPLRLGVSVGMNLTKLQPFAGHFDPDYQIFNYKYDEGLSLGFFLDQPVFQFGLSVHAAVCYSNTVFTYQKRVEHTYPGFVFSSDYSFVTTLHTLELPVHLRYTLPLSTLRPYLEFGGFINLNFYNDSYVDRIFTENGVKHDFGSFHSMVLDNLNVGPSIGLGVECPINGRHKVFLECHYTRTQGLTNPDLSKLTRITVTTGYQF